MKKTVLFLLSILSGIFVGINLEKKIIVNMRKDEFKDTSNKYLYLFLMMKQWVKVKQEGKNLAQYFNDRGYREIAIYGMGHAGEVLMEELLESNIVVKYGIDRNADKIKANIDVITPVDNMEEVDVIVVTSITYFTEVEEMLNKKVRCPIISLEDILYEV